ncbi:integrase, catalytic region, zinc finger, CCHC-type containing protein [Tanacetum coccineum]|uniref:Integrase, catalytic region, zinc finger, CCHC-type containing protein n=1 Tax=Tanacetum coccineum TaxID=301880 RepID=A0ABQ5HII4_9ASTR
MLQLVGPLENYKNASQDIRNQLDAEAEAEAVQIILTGVDNDIYSTIDACPNACEMWKAIEKLKQGESINIQDLETNLYWKFGKFTSRDGESLKSYYSRSQQATRNRGKAIVNSPPPTYDQEPTMVAEDDEMSKEKEIDKLMALISLSFKKIYKPTNNNLRTSSNTSRANHDNTPRINRGTRYDNQRAVNIARARENVEQADWRDDTDDEPDDQELEAYYMYMAQIQEVTPNVADNFGPIFDVEPLQKVQNVNDNYNVFANDREHPEQPESINDTYLKGQGGTNITIDSLDMSTNRETVDQDDDDLANERDLLSSLIEKLKCKIDDSKNQANNELPKTNQLMFKDLKKFQAELEGYYDVNYASSVEIDCAKAKVIALEINQVVDDIVYKTGQSVQTMNMLNRNCKTSFVKPEFLKKAQRANPRLYDIDCYDDNLAIMLAPESDETIHLAQESRSKLKGIENQTSTARTPEQNGVVKRWNRTLVEAARTMLSTTKVPLFFWAEIIATACFTQNRSLVIPLHEKTPYHIINGRKPSIKFFHIFGSLYYIVRDGENLDKMKEKGDACIFVGYSTQSRAYRVYNKRTRVVVETIHVNFDELPQMVSDHVSSNLVPQCPTTALEHASLSPGPQSQENVCHSAETVTTSNKLDLLFSLMFDKLLNGTTPVMLKYIPLNIQTTPEITNQAPTQAPTVTANENIIQAETNKECAQVNEDEFINIFSTPIQEQGETSSRYVDSTRRQLETDGEMCIFALTIIRTKPKNIKEAMADSAWIKAVQEELHQFDRLDVWELVDRPLYKNVINMKWLWKNKRDEEDTVIRNKARLVAKGYIQQEGIDFEESFAPVA